MKIILKKLTGLNFKGLRSFCFEFDPESTDLKAITKPERLHSWMLSCGSSLVRIAQTGKILK
jgi:hypothetical protein